MYVLLLILGIILFEGCAQYCIKKSNMERNLKYCFLAVLFYAAVVSLLYRGYDHLPMGMVNALWSGLSVLSIILIGAILYHETVTPWDWLGVGFILLGIFFIFVKGHNSGAIGKN